MAKGLEGMVKVLAQQKNVGAAQLVGASLFLKGQSDKICPHDTGHLVGSSYTKPIVERDTKLSVEVGYGADYAPYVHEMPESTNWRKPTAENKWLEKAMMRNEKKILQLMGAKLGLGGYFVK